LVPHDFIDQVADIVEFEHVGKLALKGYRAPVVACNVTSKVAAKT
jgi:class 3 adenylate cyclase